MTDDKNDMSQKTIYRPEFIKILALELKNRGAVYSVDELLFIMNAVFYVISELIKMGYIVSILNVGSFMRKMYQERVYKDKNTGMVDKVINSHLVTKFRASKNFGVSSNSILRDKDVLK